MFVIRHSIRMIIHLHPWGMTHGIHPMCTTHNFPRYNLVHYTIAHHRPYPIWVVDWNTQTISTDPVLMALMQVNILYISDFIFCMNNCSLLRFLIDVFVFEMKSEKQYSDHKNSFNPIVHLIFYFYWSTKKICENFHLPQ